MLKTIKKRVLFRLLNLCVCAFIFTSILSGQAASSLFPDITEFKLELPLDENGNDYEGVDYDDRDSPLIKGETNDNLSGWVAPSPFDQYFFVSGNELVMRAHCAGALTSANAYPRCEFRQQINGENTFWDYSDEHEINVTLRITELPNEKEEVCVVQAKGTNTPNTTDGTKEVLRVEYRQDGNSGWHLEENEANGPTNVLDYSLGQTVHIRVYINNDNVTLEMENLDNGDTYNYSYSSDYSHGYFKTGAYTQSSIWEEKNGVADENPDARSEVRFSQIELGEISGNSCTAQVPGNRSVSNVSQSGATLSWNSVPDVQDYDIRWRPTGTSSWTYNTNFTGTSLNISGLSSSTQYQWQLKSVCPNGDDTNYGQGPGPNFTTSSGGGSLPSPWETTDIGSVGASGSASYSGGTFTLQGSGSDIWNTSDEFRFVYQPLTGDGEIVARVASLSNTNSWAKSGVMMRESLSAGSKHAMMVTRPSAGTSFQRRTSTNGSSSHTSSSNGSPAIWLRVVRSGNTFTASRSTNGSSWTQVGSQTISMSSTIYVGLALTSHNDGVLATSNITNVTVNNNSNQTFTPDPTKNYYIDCPVHNLRLAASGESEDAYTTSTNNTGADVAWKFVAKGNGFWHVQRAGGGTKPRLRTDNSEFADMQPTAWNGTYTFYEFETGASSGTWFMTLPSGPANRKRLQINSSGVVRFGPTSWSGSWESFTFTEIVAGGNCTPSLPSNRQVNSTTPSSAVVSWNSTGADHYDVRYKKTANTNWIYNNNVTNTNSTLTSIVEDTEYEWQVRSQCDNGSASSWGQGPDFTTPDNFEEDSANTRSDEAIFKIYPNPSSNEIYIEGIENGERIQIFDLNGKEIIKSYKSTIQVTDLPNGLYIVRRANGVSLKFLKI